MGKKNSLKATVLDIFGRELQERKNSVIAFTRCIIDYDSISDLMNIWHIAFINKLILNFDYT